MKVKDIIKEAGWRDVANAVIGGVDAAVGSRTKKFKTAPKISASANQAQIAARTHEGMFVALHDKGREYYYFSFAGSINSFFRYDIIPESEPTTFLQGSKVDKKEVYQRIRREGPSHIKVVDISQRADMTKIAVADGTI